METKFISDQELSKYVDKLFLSDLQILSSGGNPKGNNQEINDFLQTNNWDAGEALYNLRKCFTEARREISTFPWDDYSKDSLTLVLGSNNVGEYLKSAVDYIQEKMPEKDLEDLRTYIGKFKDRLTAQKKIFATGIKPDFGVNPESDVTPDSGLTGKYGGGELKSKGSGSEVWMWVLILLVIFGIVILIFWVMSHKDKGK